MKRRRDQPRKPDLYVVGPVVCVNLHAANAGCVNGAFTPFHRAPKLLRRHALTRFVVTRNGSQVGPFFGNRTQAHRYARHYARGLAAGRGRQPGRVRLRLLNGRWSRWGERRYGCSPEKG